MAGKKKSGRKQRKPRKHHSPEKRAEILADAAQNNLTGKQVAEKYDISVMTYYVWKKNLGKSTQSGPRANRASTAPVLGAGVSENIRKTVEARVREILPEIVQAEVSAYLATIFPATRR